VEADVYIYKRPFEDEQIVARIASGSQYIMIDKSVKINGIKWSHISCYDKYRNEYRGWIRYDQFGSIDAPLDFIGTDGGEIQDSTPMISPVESNEMVDKGVSYKVVNVNHDRDLNVRTMGGDSYKIEARLPKNAKNIFVIEEKNKWLKVKFFDAYGYRYCGWVHSHYLDSEQPVSVPKSNASDNFETPR
jgi:hypothetical protein